jgi:calcineurin-like phosphoesterase family protein
MKQRQKNSSLHVKGMRMAADNKFTKQECLDLRHVCRIARQLGTEIRNQERIDKIQEELKDQEDLLINDADKKTLRWCMMLPELYCQKKLDILTKMIGTDVQDPKHADIKWFSELEKKELLHKLHASSAKAARKLYISDMHFYHNSLNKQMDCRGFKDHEAMNAYMIQKWNEKVTKKDEVYILGDLSIAKGIATNAIVKQLNGKLYFIVGNHDAFLNDPIFDQSRFQWVKQYAEIHDAGRTVVLSHYPIFCYNGQYRRKDGVPYVYMMYGHVHDTHDEKLINHFIAETKKTKVQSKYDKEPTPIPCQMINCFCMFSDYMPLTLDEWIEVDRKRRNKMNQAWKKEHQ